MADQSKTERRRRLIEALKSARNVYLFSFVGTFAATASRWVAQVSEWASTSGARPLPGLNVLGYGAVAAATAAAPAAVALLYRGSQAWLGVGTQPTYTNSPSAPDA